MMHVAYVPYKGAPDETPIWQTYSDSYSYSTFNIYENIFDESSGVKKAFYIPGTCEDTIIRDIWHKSGFPSEEGHLAERLCKGPLNKSDESILDTKSGITFTKQYSDELGGYFYTPRD